MKQKAIICDIDGTLADPTHRLHHIEKAPKDWDSFFEACDKDKLNKWCFEIIKKFSASGYKILYITGRKESIRAHTIAWLLEQNCPSGSLIMRPNNTRIHDTELKEGIYKKEVEPKYDVLFTLEDRQSVVDMWRSLGLICLQCAPGDF